MQDHQWWVFGFVPMSKANKVVKQIAEAEKYDVILQEAVYISPKHDITDKVIKVINSGK